MWIIGCDFHSGFQQVAIFDNQTGEIEEKKLIASRAGHGVLSRAAAQAMRVGMESGVPCQWFRRLLHECGHELWVGDAARIRAAETRAAEDGPARCGVDPAAAAGESLSADLDADGGRARRAAVADGPASSHADADPGEEPAAGAGAEPGAAEGTAAVVGGGPGATGRAGDDGTRGAAARSVAGNR